MSEMGETCPECGAELWECDGCGELVCDCDAGDHDDCQDD